MDRKTGPRPWYNSKIVANGTKPLSLHLTRKCPEVIQRKNHKEIKIKITLTCGSRDTASQNEMHGLPLLRFNNACIFITTRSVSCIFT